MMKLLIGGSPCTHWSIAQTKNRETEPSGIGWELFKNYLIALEKYKPDFFLYENNKSMSAAIRAQITKEFGFEPVLINSALVSAQSRQRLYWVGKREPDGTYSRVPVEQPEDKGILLRDILESGVVWREKAYTLRASAGTKQGQSNIIRSIVTNGKFSYMGVAEPVRIGTIESAAAGENAESRQYRVYSPDAKGVTLAGTDGGGGVATGLYAAPVEVEPVNVTADGKAHTIRASCYKDGIRNMVGNTIDKKTCVAIRVGDMPNADGEVKGSQSGRIYSVDGKSVSLQARPNGGGADGAATGLYAVPAGMAWRGRGDSSSYEMRDDDHVELLEALKAHKGPAIISGYDSDLYNRELKGWYKDGRTSFTQTASRRKEIIWMNFEPAAQMDMFREG